MKGKFKKVVSLILATTMLTASAVASPTMAEVFDGAELGYVHDYTVSDGSLAAMADTVQISQTTPWFEAAAVEWTSYSNATGYNVYYKTGSDAYTKIDDELVRNNRADVLGLKGDTSYDIKVVPIVSGAEVESASAVTNVTTMTYDRSGYAFFKGTTTGGYNSDGTVPSNAVILYVNDSNKDTISYGGYTGIANIMSQASLKAMGKAGTPLIVRLMGTINPPANLNHDDGPNMLYAKQGTNVTVEGVGYDTMIYGWGFSMNTMTNLEVRNLDFYWYPEDALGVQLNSSRIWIHNNEFRIGHCDNPSESDKADGDGASDIKKTDFVTISYNHYNGAKKTALIGLKNDSADNFNISFHHNYIEGTNSRTPRARMARIHVYNNYFSGVTGYGIGASCNSRIFSENNYFENTNRPMLQAFIANAGSTFSDDTGGVVKAYNNVLVNCTNYIPGTDYYLAKTRDEEVKTSGYNDGLQYENFESNSSVFYVNDYKLHSPSEAKQVALTFAGRIKQKHDYNYKVIEVESESAEGVVNKDPAGKVDSGGSEIVVGTPDMYLNAGDLTTDSTGTSVRTQGGFTLTPGTKTITVEEKGASYSTITAKKRMKLSGSGSTDSCNVSFTVEKPCKVRTLVLSTGSDARTLVLADASGKQVGTFAANASSTTPDLNEVYISTPGTYYLYSAGSGLFLYYVDVTYTDDVVTTTDNTTESTTATVTESTTATATESTTETVTESTTSINPGDRMYGDADQSGILEANDAAMIMQYVLSPAVVNFNDEMKVLVDVDADGVITANDAAMVMQKVLNGSYVLPVENGKVPETTESTTETTTNESTTNESTTNFTESSTQETTVIDTTIVTESTTQGTTESTESTTAGVDYVYNISNASVGEVLSVTNFNGFEVNPATDTGSAVTIEKNSKSYNGVSYTNRLKLGGTGSLNSRSVKFTTTGEAIFTVIGVSSSSTATRVGNVWNENGEVVATAEIGTSIGAYKFAIPGAGTYTFGSAASGINIYELKVTYGGGQAVVGDLENMNTPVTGLAMETIYVSPKASPTAAGTEADPMSIAAALVNVKEGGTIYLTGGRYYFDSVLKIQKGNNGADGAVKRIEALNGEEVVLDFSEQSYNMKDTSKNARGLQINGDYWYVKGIEVYGSADNGFYICGNYNTLELCVANSNRDTGVQIGRSSSTEAEFDDWPSYNLVLNCTAYNNNDTATGENADGFAAKLTCGNGNVFDGCIAYNNVDDGWDLFAKEATGAIGPVTIKNCISFRNGQTVDGVFTENSDGNGFKMGGSNIAVQHVIENCIAFENKNHGFTDNSNPGPITVKNCTSYNNAIEGGTNKSNFDYARDKTSKNIFINNLSYAPNKIASDKFAGHVTNSVVYNKDKGVYYYYEDILQTLWSDKEGTAMSTGVSDSTFVSVATPMMGADVHKAWRNADGSLNIGDFLKIKETDPLYGTNVGAYIG